MVTQSLTQVINGIIFLHLVNITFFAQKNPLFCSPGEEMALVDHMKGMSLTAGAKRELKSLLHCLMMLGKEDNARKLQRICENFQLSQMAAVKLAEDAMSSDSIDEHEHSLERYIQKVRKELPQSEAFSWQCKVLLSP